MEKRLIIIAAFNMAVAIILGAYASHGLRETASPTIAESFSRGVTYHIYHSLALIMVALLLYRHPSLYLQIVAFLFLFGILFFSVGIYAVNIAKLKAWDGLFKMVHFLPPYGGFAFILGWLMIAFSFIQKNLK